MTEEAHKTKGITDKVEKIIIALLLASLLIYFFIVGEKDLKSSEFYSIILFLEFILAGFYIYLTKNKYSIFLVGFMVLTTGFYVEKIDATLGKQLILVGELTQFALGIFFAYKTILESKKNKDWEMFETLVSIALLFPLIYHFILSGDELLMVYHFALAFILGTIIYNENLWDKYNYSEKKILTYVLVTTIVEVLIISIRLL